MARCVCTRRFLVFVSCPVKVPFVVSDWCWLKINEEFVSLENSRWRNESRSEIEVFFLRHETFRHIFVFTFKHKNMALAGHGSDLESGADLGLFNRGGQKPNKIINK